MTEILKSNQKTEITSEIVKINFVNTKKDFWQQYLHHSFSGKMLKSKFFLFVFIFVFLVIIQSISSNFKMNYQLWLPIYFFGIPIFWEYVMFLAATINITNTIIFPKTFTFSKELIKADLGWDEINYKWSSLVEVKQDKNYYYFIFINKMKNADKFIIPKKILDKEQISKLEYLLLDQNKI